MSGRAQKIGFATAILVVAVALSRVLGFAREMVIAQIFGATGATDAYNAAFRIPDMLNYLVAGGTFSLTFIPIYTRHLTANDEAEGDRVFSIIVTIMAPLFALLVIALEVATPVIAHRYLHKLSPEDLELSIQLTRILLPAQWFFYIGGLCSATLFARHRFTAAALAPLLYNLGTIAGAIIGGRSLGVQAMTWGTLAGAIVGPFAIQAFASRAAGVRYRPIFDVRHPDFRRWLLATLPLMIGVALVTADEWIISYFAAAERGAITCLNYARKLALVPVALAGQAVGQASMPFFSRLFAEGKLEELGELVVTSAGRASQVAALAGFAFVALAVPTVEVLFHHGRFAGDSVAPTAFYLQIFAAATPLWVMQAILSRAFYAAGDTWTPMVAGTIVTVLALPIYWIAQHQMGTSGLTVASGLGIFLHTAALFILVGRKVILPRRRLVNALVRAELLGLCAWAAAWLALHWLPAGHLGHRSLELVRLGVGGFVFIAVSLGLSRPLGVEGVHALADKVARRIRG